MTLCATTRGFVPSPLTGEGQGEGFSVGRTLTLVTTSEPLTRRSAPTSPLRGEVEAATP